MIVAFQELEALPGDGPLDAPPDLPTDLALSPAASRTGAGSRVVTQPYQRNRVQGPVEPAVPAAVQPMASDPPGGRRDRADAGQAAKAASERSRPASPRATARPHPRTAPARDPIPARQGRARDGRHRRVHRPPPAARDLPVVPMAIGIGLAVATAASAITLNQGQGEGEVCFDLSWAGIDGTVVAAHTHAAPAGSPVRWWSRCCGCCPGRHRQRERLRAGGERRADQGHQARPGELLRERSQHGVSGGGGRGQLGK